MLRIDATPVANPTHNDSTLNAQIIVAASPPANSYPPASSNHTAP